MRRVSMANWVLSRRDSTIVARHEVPGIMKKIAPSQRDAASLHRYTGSSCLATIRLSLRDKSHSPS
jgi:hypothetical protein